MADAEEEIEKAINKILLHKKDGSGSSKKPNAVRDRD